MRETIRKAIYLYILLLSCLVTHGCFFYSNPASVDNLNLKNTNTLTFNLLLPENEKSKKANSITSEVYAIFRLKLFNFKNTAAPYTTVLRKVLVLDNSATVTFKNLPQTTILGEVEILNGKVGAYNNFHGAIDLTIGTNNLYLAPVGCLMKEDIVANTLDRILKTSSLFAGAKPGLTQTINLLTETNVKSTETAYNDVLSAYASDNSITTNFEDLFKYIKTFSMPIEIIDIGALTAYFAKTPPKLLNKLYLAKFKHARFSIRPNSTSIFDYQNGYTYSSTNYTSENDYDPIDPIGRSSFNIKYLSNSNQIQSQPDLYTAKLILQGTSEEDYSIYKMLDNKGKFECTVNNLTSNWMNTSQYYLDINDQGRVVFETKSFSYSKRGHLVVDANSGKILSGNITDQLSSPEITIEAWHNIANNQFTTTYLVGSMRESIITPIPENKDEFRYYQWTNPTTFVTESLSLILNGSLIPNLKAQNDRINSYYSSDINVVDIANTTFARVFRHACNYDPIVNKIFEVAQTAYPNNLSDQVNYCIGFVTKGIVYQSDIINFSDVEYVCTPSMTLYNKSGDCEDQAILLAALVKKAGFDVALVLLNGDYNKHAIAGIHLPPELEAQRTSGAVYIDYYGKKYFLFEATNYIEMNDYRQVCENNGYSLAAIIPSETTSPVLRGSIAKLIKQKK